MMKKLFEHTSSTWVRYSEYEWKKAEDGVLYLTPADNAELYGVRSGLSAEESLCQKGNDVY